MTVYCLRLTYALLARWNQDWGFDLNHDCGVEALTKHARTVTGLLPLQENNSIRFKLPNKWSQFSMKGLIQDGLL